MMRALSIAFAAMLVLLGTAAPAAPLKDLSDIRGFNYVQASVTDEAIYLQYSDAEVRRDFGYARSIGLNQARVFLRYSEWANDTPKFRDSFRKLLAVVRDHDMQIMFALIPPRAQPGAPMDRLDALTVAWLKDVLGMARGHREILVWDVANEPDYIGHTDRPIPPEVQASRMAKGKLLADYVHKFDRRALTTVGCWNVACIEVAEPFTDILTYHDYSPTRALIAANAQRAKAFAAKVGKPVLQTEVGCTGRSSPYDMALREYRKVGMGTYIWELMVGKRWGTIHGIFYPDGTVRDPVIAAAVMGIFRNEGADRVLEVPDEESWISVPLQRGAKWLADVHPGWEEGLEIAETEANTIEANQLAAMRVPPSLTVKRLREGSPNIPALRLAIQNFAAVLTPYAGLGRKSGN